MKTEPDCYGKMFPTVAVMAHNEPVKGQVFDYHVDYTGQVASDAVATVDRQAWRQCLGCADFDGCYRLSSGTILMELALRSLPVSLYSS